MLLGFKRRFAPFVEDGSKTHTIRRKRKQPKRRLMDLLRKPSPVSPRVGEICHCYVDPRQKTMRLLGRFECVRVQEITMEWLAEARGFTVLITIDGQELDRAEANLLAFRDGFRSNGVDCALDELHRYWHQLHGHAAFPFHGQLIHWRFER